MNNKQAK